MDDFFVLVVMPTLAFLGGPWLLAFLLFRRMRAAEARLAALETKLAAAPPATLPVPIPLPIPPPVADIPPAPPPEAAAPEPPPEAVPEPVPAAAAVLPDADKTSEKSAPKPSLPKPSLEEWLTGRLGVIVGALALGLGGIFLVRYSIEAGLLGPGMRVFLGLMMGLGLHGAAERVRRRAVASGQSAGFVPAALAAGGSVAIYAAIYAAHGLYGMIPSAVAFPLLALAAAATAAAALLHGPMVATLAVGLVYVMPLLIERTTPQPAVLFGYFALAGAGFLLLARWGAWGWLTITVGAATTLWHLAGMIEFGDEAWWQATIALMVQAGFTGWFLTRPPLGRVPVGSLGPLRLPLPALVAVVIVGLWGLLIGLWLWIAGIGSGPVFLWQISFIGIALLARRRPVLLPVVPWLAGGSLLLAALWQVPGPVDLVVDQPWVLTGSLIPDAIRQYLTGLILMAATLTILPAAIASEGTRSARGLWASTAVTASLILLAVAYARVTGFEVSLPFVAVGLAVAAGWLGMAAGVTRRSSYLEDSGLTATLAAYAAGVICALSLAAAMGLRDSWLTLALALPLPALGMIWRRLRVPGLATLTGLLAGAVALRLLLNPEVLDYGMGALGVAATYGLPAALCFAAAWQYGQVPPTPALTRLTDGLRSAGLAFLAYLIGFEALILDSGTPDPDRLGLTSLAVTLAGWLLLAYVQQRMGRRRTALVLAGIVALGVVLGSLLRFNPLYIGEPVGSWPLLNSLTLAYAVPAGLFLLLARRWQAEGEKRLVQATGLGAFVLLLVWITLEVRRAFVGPDLSVDELSNGEWYSYSAAWLLFGIALVTAGLWRSSSAMRGAGLLLVTLATLKIFLFDMAELGGLLRALSFIGLGGVLVGIGYTYQRLLKRGAGTGEAGG